MTRLPTVLVLAALVIGCSSQAPEPGDESERSTTRQALAAPAPQPISCGPNSTGAEDSGPCLITKTRIDARTTRIRIDRPVVNQSSYEYPVSFQPGDIVTVQAGGCAQTGGFGKTWKRYVDPEGDNSDRFYFGQITIPGVNVPSLGGVPLLSQRLRDVLGQPLQVPRVDNAACDGVEVPKKLILGYPDDQYDDNGYDNRDNGNDCESQPDAFVELTVAKSNIFADDVAEPAAHQDFDVVDNGLDCNLLFSSPGWGWQKPGVTLCSFALGIPMPPGCVGAYNRDSPQTNQPTLYDRAPVRLWPDAILTLGLLCSHDAFETDLSGHRNWFDASYTGTVRWHSHDAPLTGDDDYNLLLLSPKVGDFPALITANNSDRVKLEFDSDETIDRFDSIPWWKAFHDAVDDSDDRARAFLDDKDVVVVGLIGIDEEHNGSEIHPVHALAVHSDPSFAPPPPPRGILRDHWSYFARNWGDEGECSSQQHYLDATHLSLQLKRPAGVPANATATLDTSLSKSMHVNTPRDIKIVSKPGKDVFVTFAFGPGSASGMYAGELFLNWPAPATSAAPAPAASPSVDPSASAAVSAADDENANDEKGELRDLVAALTPEQLEVYRTALATLLPPSQPPLTEDVPIVATDDLPVRPAAMPSVSVGPAPRQLQRFDAQARAFCVSTRGGNEYATPLGGCPNVPPFTTATVTPGLSQFENCFFSPYVVTLTARDGSGAGIARTEFSLDGVTFSTYAGPIMVNYGVDVHYRSVDKLNNVEETKTVRTPNPAGDTALTSLLLLADGQLSVEDGALVSGLIANDGTTGTTVGVEAHVNDIRSRARIDLRDRATVDGSIETAARVSFGNGVRISGSVAQGADVIVPDLAACQFDIPAPTSNDINLEPSQTRVITAGTYRSVIVKSRAVLHLSAGVYFFDSLDSEPQASLVLDDTSGPTLLFVRNGVIWRGAVSGGGRLFLGYAGTQSVVLEAPFVGMLVAPRAGVAFRSLPPGSFLGQYFAKDLDIGPRTSVAGRVFKFGL